jgi:hypothetical protein
MWPVLESMLSTLALVPKVQVLELYGVLPSGHSPSSDQPLTDLWTFRSLTSYISAAQDSILVLFQLPNLSENVRVFVTLRNIVTEDGPCS